MRKFISEYFSFSKRELKSLILFQAFLIIAILIRIIIPRVYSTEIISDPGIYAELKAFSESFKEKQEFKPYTKTNTYSSEKPHQLNFDYFDPNLISKKDLINFGLPERIADNIIKYRKAGGIFKTGEDLLRIYGMKEVSFEKILPWIQIQIPDEEFNQPKIPDSAEHLAINPVELNSCDFQSLVEILPSNSKLAGRILNYKDLLGGYYSTRQLKEVYGMSDSLLESIMPFILADTSVISKISIGKSEYRELIRHPYLSKQNVDLIMSYRKYAGSEINLQDFRAIKILPDSIFSLIAPYLRD